jgi:hypothetical protein
VKKVRAKIKNIVKKEKSYKSKCENMNNDQSECCGHKETQTFVTYTHRK